MQTRFSSQNFFLSILIAGVFSFISLFLIPGDAKNARFFGFSSMRLAMLGAMFFFVLATGWLTYSVSRSPAWYKKFSQQITKFLESKGYITSLLTILLWGLISGTYFLFLTFTTTDQFKLSYFYRLAPWFFWVASVCGISLFFLSFREV